jgi:hypothetical protein
VGEVSGELAGKTALAVEAAWIEVSADRAELACYVDLVPCCTAG